MAKLLNVPGWYSFQELAGRFLWSRLDLNETVEREGFERKEVGRGYLFSSKHVEIYAKTLTRTHLARLKGIWTIKKLLRDTDMDTTCPRCGAFAIWDSNAETATFVQKDILIHLNWKL